MTTTVPPNQVCPLCGYDDYVIAMPVGQPGEWDFTCTGTTGHTAPYTWHVTAQHDFVGREGITAELGVYDDLLSCLHPGDPWVEHGVVEHRYKQLRPDVYFGELIPTYGHVAQGPKRYTVSVFLARALSQLLHEGAVGWQYAAATGFWSYNTRISFWSLFPTSATENRLTWESYAKDRGIDPVTWDLNDPRG